MLVLSRERDQVITIGDDIEVTVVDIRGGKVRLGVSAPRALPIHRKEIYDEIKKSGAVVRGLPEHLNGRNNASGK